MRHAVLLVFFTLALGAPRSSRAQADAPYAVQAFVWNTSGVAVRTGLVLGGGLEARRSFDHGLFLGGRLAMGSMSESTADWDFTYLHLLACAAGGIEQRIGVGILQAQLDLGVLGIRQLGRHKQYDRLVADSVTGLDRNGWSFGPVASVELGAAVAFYGPWRAFLQLGPGFTVQRVGGNAVARWFFSSSLGVGRAF